MLNWQMIQILTVSVQGEGIARQRRAIIDGLKESIADFSNEITGVDPKDVLDLVLITQYFDTMKV